MKSKKYNIEFKKYFTMIIVGVIFCPIIELFFSLFEKQKYEFRLFDNIVLFLGFMIFPTIHLIRNIYKLKNNENEI